MEYNLKQVLSSDQLPTLPQVALRIVQLVQQDEPDFPAIVEMIRSDPAIAARILKTANSALFGFRQNFSSIEAAIPALGADLVRALVLSFTLARHRSPRAELELVYQCFWRRALTQAAVAEALAVETASLDPGMCFTGGLLQDVGMLALLCAYPAEYCAAMQTGTQGVNVNLVEVQSFGFSHVDIGVELCRRWGLEDALLNAVSLHHDPATTSETKTSGTDLILALATASQCADYLETLRADDDASVLAVPPLLESAYGLAPSAIAELLGDVALRVSELSAMLSVEIGTTLSSEQILQRANTALQQVAVAGQIEAVVARRKAGSATERLKQVESKLETLEQQALRDPLTRAYNRTSISEHVKPQLAIRSQQGHPVGCLFLDIDNFKGINDRYGHEFGDQVLEKVAQILHECVRSSDIVVRYGGDEFLVVLMESGITKAKVSRVAKRICRRINKSRIAAERPVTISSSVGAVYCSIRRDRALNSQRLIGEADRAMYDAKNRGGNQVHLAWLEA